MDNGINNDYIFNEIKTLMQTADLEEIDEKVQEYADLCNEDNLEFPTYEEEVFCIAVREGNADYVYAHANDFDLNSSEDSWGNPTCPYIYEAKDDSIVQILYDCGAYVDWEEYESYPIAIDTSNGFVISFTAEFQEEVYKKILDYLGYDTDEFVETIEDDDLASSVHVFEYTLSSVMNIFEWRIDDDEVVFEDFGFTSSDEGYAIRDILTQLGYEFQYVGNSSRREHIGVYFIE